MKTRRKFSEDFKADVLAEIAKGERGIAEIAKSYDVPATLLYRWKRDAAPVAKTEPKQAESGAPSIEAEIARVLSTGKPKREKPKPKPARVVSSSIGRVAVNSESAHRPAQDVELLRLRMAALEDLVAHLKDENAALRAVIPILSRES